MKVYQALYCPCIHESSYGTISLHKSYEGARRAVIADKLRERKRWHKHRKWEIEKGHSPEMWHTLFIHQDWDIEEIKILD